MVRRVLLCVLVALFVPAVASGAGRFPSCRGQVALVPVPACVQNCDAARDACNGKCSAGLKTCMAQCMVLGFMCDYSCRAAFYGCQGNCAKAHDSCAGNCPDRGGQQ